MEDQAAQEARPAQRRPEAARGHRPRPDQQAAGAAARRAAGRAGPQAAPAHADRAGPDPRRGRHHLPLRHPRPGRGHEPERPHRGDERAAASSRSARRPRSTRRRAPASWPPSSATPTSSRAQVAEVVDGDYSRLAIDGFPDVLCFNDKQISVGNPVFLSVRPEKFRIARDRPARGQPPQRRPGPGRGRDLPRLAHQVLGPRPGLPHGGLPAAQPLPARREADPLERRRLDLRGTPTTASCWSATARRRERSWKLPPEERRANANGDVDAMPSGLTGVRAGDDARESNASAAEAMQRVAGHGAVAARGWCCFSSMPTLIVFAITFKPADPYGGIGARLDAGHPAQPGQPELPGHHLAHHLAERRDHRDLHRCWPCPPATTWPAVSRRLAADPAAAGDRARSGPASWSASSPGRSCSIPRAPIKQALVVAGPGRARTPRCSTTPARCCW